MPTNVTYEFIAAKEKYEKAKTDDEKIIALQEMLSKAPTHKGAENLRKDISRKIAAIKNKVDKRLQVLKKQGHTINIKKEGAGQVVILGLTNVGKSTFLKKYTNAKPLIAPYNYTTTKPEVGILNYGGALIQLIELPSFLESKEYAMQIISMVRVSDGVVFIVNKDPIFQINKLLNLLEDKNIYINKKKPKIEIIRSEFSGVTFINENNLLISKEKATKLLKDSGFKSHTFILNQKTSLEDLLLIINPRIRYISGIAVSMSPISEEIINASKIPIFYFEDKEIVTENIFSILNKIIVFTKKPGTKVKFGEPLVLDAGSTVLDAAKIIHKTIFKNLKSAKVWGSSKYKGQTVSKNYELKNKDIVEFII